jgi:hypothetical protein
MLHAPPLVIGLRSIGSGLAAIAAAALEAPAPVTLRPGGNPFRRSLSIDPELAAYLLEGDRHFVIVDEGPGLSGSSFGCVADWLEDHVCRRIASPFCRAMPVTSDPSRRRGTVPAGRGAATGRAPDRLAAWIADLLGPIERWTDISAGAWRPLWKHLREQWPPWCPAGADEVLVRAGGSEWMVRFAGLGAGGQDKLELARLLAERGLRTGGRRPYSRLACDALGAVMRRLAVTVDELRTYLALRSNCPPFGARASPSSSPWSAATYPNSPLGTRRSRPAGAGSAGADRWATCRPMNGCG